ncbi:MAG: hypothetical protein AABX54_01485 [Nanoarchaeota archaeon]
MEDEEMKKEAYKAFKESELAWQEFFKNKPEPTNDEEEKKEQEEYCHWYNYVRKQSDTGKTPAEMYKEIYGKEPPQNFPIGLEEPSRMMNFEWDDEDDFDEGDDEEEIDELDLGEKLDDAQEEAVVVATKIFEKSWKQIKREIEGASKREACKYSFIIGFLNYMNILDKEAKQIKDNMKDMSEEDLKEMIKDFKEYEEKREK